MVVAASRWTRRRPSPTADSIADTRSPKVPGQADNLSCPLVGGHGQPTERLSSMATSPALASGLVSVAVVCGSAPAGAYMSPSARARSTSP